MDPNETVILEAIADDGALLSIPMPRSARDAIWRGEPAAWFSPLRPTRTYRW